MEFGTWGDSIQEYEGQSERLTRAREAAVTPQSVDPISKTGIFSGRQGKAYVTSLESCSCQDFTRRKLPCKHMYRLAMELGLIEADFVSGINKYDYYAAIDSLDEPLQILLYELAGNRRHCSAPPYYELYLRSNELDTLVSRGFCVEAHGEYVACAHSHISKKVIFSALKEAGLHPAKQKFRASTRWKTVFQYIQSLYSEVPDTISHLFIAVDLEQQSFEYRNKIYSYIRKKYGADVLDNMDDD